MRQVLLQAPEFPDNLEWLNTKTPIRLKEQRGKLILIDFWTYCCINCLHVLSDLTYLENKYADALLVIGLHSPKFPNEKINQHVQQAIARYEIHHPVANDPNFQVWQQYGIHAWPTLVLINQQGQIIRQFQGEGHRYEIDQLIEEQLKLSAKKTAAETSSLLSHPIKSNSRILSFPEKILATPDHIFVSNTGKHQIITLDYQGQIKSIMGKGARGYQDGDINSAQFNSPRGLALYKNYLLIADTGNHRLRQIDLSSSQVSTLAGTGVQGKFYDYPAGLGLQVALNSPWDIAVYGDWLFIAMAGFHQIWAMDLITHAIGILAGSGREDIKDGKNLLAAFAQPSALSMGKDYLYIADAETSAIRQIDLRKGYTRTLVGTGLFDYGDQDGEGKLAKLQHPLGVCFDEALNVLWIADSYNHKLKQFNLQDNIIRSINIQETLAEPSGLSVLADSVWIADTNQHRIVKFNLQTQTVQICQP